MKSTEIVSKLVDFLVVENMAEAEDLNIRWRSRSLVGF